MSKENGNTEELVFKNGETINEYKLVQKIDEGGFGQVWKCTKDNITFCAIKLESNSQDGGSAIKLEMNVLKQLSGESVFPQILAGGRKQRFHYLVLELLGDNLKMLKARSPNPEVLSDGTWSRIGIQCLYALKVMHTKAFVHRDIKPSNFAIGVNTANEIRSRRILLFDFGLARKFVIETQIQPVPKVTSKVNLTRGKTVAPTAKGAGHTSKKSQGSPNTQQNRQVAGITNRLKAPNSGRRKTDATVDDHEKEKEKGPTKLEVFRRARPHTDFRGTHQYASPNAHAQIELGRHDDIWSLMYMIAEMFLELPWTNNEDFPVEVLKGQSTILTLFTDEKTPTRLTPDMTSKLSQIDKMLKGCNYYSHPDYDLVYELFKSVMVKSGVSWSTPYDWETGKDELSKAAKKTKGDAIWEKPGNFFKENRWSHLNQNTSSVTTAKETAALDKNFQKSLKPKTSRDIPKNKRSGCSREDSANEEDNTPETPAGQSKKDSQTPESKKSGEQGKR